MPARLRLAPPLAALTLLAACGGGSDAPPPPECTVPADCPGASTACLAITCEAGRCGVDPAPAAPVGTQVPGDCQEVRCDGAGNQVSVADDADLPADDGNACTREICETGAPAHPPALPGTTCGTGAQRCDGSTCVDAPSCKAVLAAGASTGDGAYTIDPDGAGARAPFPVWCDMTTDGGGWTLVTSVTGAGDVALVGDATLVAPTQPGNATNRALRLPDAAEILVVNDGKDPGFEEAFDRADKYGGLTDGLGLTWEQLLGAFNQDNGNGFTDTGYQEGELDVWTFTAARVNTSGCLQGPLRGEYGSGNYAMGNVYDPTLGIDFGLLWHHWGQETWLSGALGGAAASDLRCEQISRLFDAYWKGLYLR